MPIFIIIHLLFSICKVIIFYLKSLFLRQITYILQLEFYGWFAVANPFSWQTVSFNPFTLFLVISTRLSIKGTVTDPFILWAIFNVVANTFAQKSIGNQAIYKLNRPDLLWGKFATVNNYCWLFATHSVKNSISRSKCWCD